jgi:hypothetical protein
VLLRSCSGGLGLSLRSRGATPDGSGSAAGPDGNSVCSAGAAGCAEPQALPLVSHNGQCGAVHPKPVLVIDGSRFTDFTGFAEEFTRLLTDYTWTGSLDAFNDILRGGFGTPEEGFVLRWDHSDQSRLALGYEATVARLNELLLTCHPTNREPIQGRIARAQRRDGPTLFDEIVELIQIHGPGGYEADNEVELELR